MIAERPININEEYRRIVLQGEPVLDNSQNLVIISMKSYEEMVKAKHNAEYMAEIDRRVERLARGEGVHRTMEELRAMEKE
ncbi:MAG: hypothetical protein HFH68_09095 [Lachnospiraceae bacterium]|nr:hypothetical protein [Lachnospiraceae bacterium]